MSETHNNPNAGDGSTLEQLKQTNRAAQILLLPPKHISALDLKMPVLAEGELSAADKSDAVSDNRIITDVIKRLDLDTRATYRSESGFILDKQIYVRLKAEGEARYIFFDGHKANKRNPYRGVDWRNRTAREAFIDDFLKKPWPKFKARRAIAPVKRRRLNIGRKL